MASPSKPDLLESLKPLFKASGFRKRRTTWTRASAEAIAVFNIQTSQWDSDAYYINLGIYVLALGDRTDPAEYQCHIRKRLNPSGKTAKSIHDEAIRWFENRASIAQIKARAPADSRTGLVTVDEILALK